MKSQFFFKHFYSNYFTNFRFNTNKSSHLPIYLIGICTSTIFGLHTYKKSETLLDFPESFHCRQSKLLRHSFIQKTNHIIASYSFSNFVSKTFNQLPFLNQIIPSFDDSTAQQDEPSTHLLHCEGPHPLWRSKQKQRMNKKQEETVVFSGTANRPLAESIATCLGTTLGKVRLSRFSDGEVNLQFLESLRGNDVFIIQATSPPVNESLIELLLMISTSRRSSAKKITAVIPYYGYARQDRKLHSRVPISAADVAKMIEGMGVDRVVSVDLHCGQIQGFFGPSVPVDNLEAQIIGIDYFLSKSLHSPIIVSPDAGGVHRARKFQEGLKKKGLKDVGLAMLVKQRLRPNEVERMDLVGSVENCDCIIVDDMIDTAGTLCEAVSQLKARGARTVYAFATHGLFSGPALSRIEKSALKEVVISDSIQQDPKTFAATSKIKQLSIAPLIADAIRRIHQKESLQQLFTN